MYNYECHRDKNNVFVIGFEEKLDESKHFHNCMEFIYVVDGEVVAHIDDIEYSIHSGQLCVVSCFSAHYYETKKIGQFIVCLIPHRFFREYEHLFNANTFDSPVIDDLSPQPLLNICLLLKNITSNLNIFGESTDNITSKFKDEQLHHLLAYLVNFFINHCGLHERQRISSLVADAVNIIENNIKDDISTTTICKKLGCSQKNLSYNFKKTMNISIINYINRARTLEAARLLSNYPQMTNEAIMYESGFKSSRTFLRYFKNFFGCTPLEYKNLSKNKK